MHRSLILLTALFLAVTMMLPATADARGRFQGVDVFGHHAQGLQFIGGFSAGGRWERINLTPDTASTFMLDASLGLGYGTRTMLFRVSGLFAHQSEHSDRRDYMAAGGGFQLSWYKSLPRLSLLAYASTALLSNEVEIDFWVTEYPELYIRDLFTWMAAHRWLGFTLGMELKLVKFNWDAVHGHGAVREVGFGPIVQLDVRTFRGLYFRQHAYVRLTCHAAGARAAENFEVTKTSSATIVVGTRVYF